MSALITDDDVEALREQIDNLALTFIAPLGADDSDNHALEVGDQRSEISRHKTSAAALQHERNRACAILNLGSGGCANMLIDHAGNSGFRRCADHAFFLAAVLKKNQRRNALDAESLRHRRIIIHVQLHHAGVAGVLLGDGFDRRREHTAWRAPGGPKINQHRLIGFQYIILKTAVVYFFDVVTHERTPCVLLLIRLSTMTADYCGPGICS